jgi:predicted RNA binding protein with dsRBD fold (UPF0201 family)
MAYTRTQVRKLLNAGEIEIFESSRAEAVKELNAPRLIVKVKRARTLRDKYRDLLKRQRLATRARTGSKAGNSGDANQRTREKAEVFAEILERFEKRLALVEAAEARAAKKESAERARLVLSKKRAADAARAAKRKAVAGATTAVQKTVGATRKKGPQPTTESALTARGVMQFKVAGQQRIRAHVAAKGRRSQAKRDGRG